MGLGLGKINIQKITERSVRAIATNLATMVLTNGRNFGLGASPRFMHVTDSSIPENATESNVQWTAPYNMHLVGIGAKLGIALGVGENITLDIREGGVSLAPAITFTDADTAILKTAVLNEDVLAGSLLCWRYTTTLGGGNVNSLSILYERDI